MRVLPIIQSPHKILAQKAKPVRKITPEILSLIEDMKYTLTKQEHPKGVGLAAPQIGKSIRLFLGRSEDDAPFKVFINPEIKLEYAKVTPKTNPDTLEGCLSIKNMWGVVDRAPIVTIKYLDGYGKQHNKTIKGFMAQIIQHEYDHLQGILFPLRVLEGKHNLYESENEKTFTSVGPAFNV